MACREFFRLIGILAVIFVGSSVQSDQLDCKEVQCPPIPEVQCPADSILQTYNNFQQIDQEKSDTQFNDIDPDDIDNDNDNDDDDVTMTRNEHNRRHVPSFHNFYVDKNEDETEHVLTRRSLQYKRRESIKIVPGDYISLVPEASRYHHLSQNHHKWKREISDKSQNDTKSKNTVEQCCPKPKCVCTKHCDIPSCDNKSEVLMETKSGSDIPGECCPQYKCDAEPNCTEMITTKTNWLLNCQSCECLYGQKICHNTCGEVHEPPSNCLSTNLKRPFFNGQIWKEDECTQCECQNGETKCQTSFCRPIKCPNIIKIPGECCPICVPETSPSAPTSSETILNTTDTDLQTPDDITTSIPLTTPSTMIPSTTPTTPPPTTTTTSTTTTMRTTIFPPIDPSSTTPTNEIPPCQTNYSNSRSSDADIIEKIHPEDNLILYIIIIVLLFICIVCFGLYCHERTKKRSYRSVPSVDSNLNKYTSTPLSNA